MLAVELRGQADTMLYHFNRYLIQLAVKGVAATAGLLT